ncbi:MAG: hypothetical protein KC462_09555, partial [Cyanobacteria bacterium HKST-UBA05]|nr:hypothetical protein [Cyanobacteria bacterium HKST-UBA05]
MPVSPLSSLLPASSAPRFGVGNRRWFLGRSAQAVGGAALATTSGPLGDVFAPTRAQAQEGEQRTPPNDVIAEWRRFADNFGREHNLDLSGRGSRIGFISIFTRCRGEEAVS